MSLSAISMLKSALNKRDRTIRQLTVALLTAEQALAVGFTNCDEDPECVFAEPLKLVRAALKEAQS